MTDDLILEFKACLADISFARAGWDVRGMSLDQKQAEASAKKTAMARAREIWRDNPGRRDEIEAAFREYKPLATLDEITRQEAGK